MHWLMPEIEAGELLLRPWQITDRDALCAAWQDPTIRQIGQVPSDCSALAAQRWISGAVLRAEAGVALDLVIDRGGHCVGEVGVSHVDNQRRAGLIGWWVAADQRRRGYATAAVRAFSGWLLSEGGLDAVVAEIDPANIASRRVAETSGFLVLRDGGATDTTVMVWRSPQGTARNPQP